MTRFSKTVLLMGLSVIALNACSSERGPGPIGTKDDIVVRNNGIPGAVQEDVAAAAPAGETIEGVSPAVESAAQAMEAENAPMGSTAATPTGDVTTVPTTEAAAESLPVDTVAPQERVRDQTVAVPTEAEMVPVADAQTSAPMAAEPAPAPTAISSVYPSSDYPAQAAAAAPESAPAAAAAVPAPAAAPVPSSAPVHHSSYPLDPNAPYSPKAMAAATEVAGAGTAATAAPSAIRSAAENIIAAKTALKAKGLYSGKEDATMDAAFLNALTLYQGTNNLPQGGLNAETLAHMGVAQ